MISEQLEKSYKYEVFEGQHTTTAKEKLFHENPRNPLYNQGINDKEALRLASRHNDIIDFILRMTHKNYASSVCFNAFKLQSCQAMLLEIHQIQMQHLYQQPDGRISILTPVSYQLL